MQLASSLLFSLASLSGASAVAWSCPPTGSLNGPCFSTPKTWREAQQICENHGSNLATLSSAELNTTIGTDGCFAPAPWNDWECAWMGATDLITEGTFEWTSGTAFGAFDAWGTYEPATGASGEDQSCGQVCKGGVIEGYSGNFWIDDDCTSEYPFCCDPDTFSLNSGTTDDNSFMKKLEAAEAVVTAAPTPADPNPYADRRLCFSTKQTWEDAQSLCKSVGSNLITIHNQNEFDHLSETAYFSPVAADFGLSWKCLWAGWSDSKVEGEYEWVSKENPVWNPVWGAFEAGNGAGDDDDCVMICKSDCAPGDTSCVDLSDYDNYDGTFLADTKCSDEYSFCCDGIAANYVAEQNAVTEPPSPAPKDDDKATIAALGAVAGIATVTAMVSGFIAYKKTRQYAALSSGGGLGKGGAMELTNFEL